MRKLLILSVSPIASTLSDQLSAAGWIPCPAVDAGEARTLLIKEHVYVGVALVPSAADDRQFQWMRNLMLSNRQLKWIAILQREDLEKDNIANWVNECFYDYHVLPVDMQRLLHILGHAYGMVELAKFEEEREQAAVGQYGLIGNSRAMRVLFRHISKAVGVEVPVLITGESGTGKECVARAIHQYSARSQGPFVAINCTTLPASLIQSELFGHERGAFTGAGEQRIGHIETANGGTLFFDEIGDLPLELQANLLRFLQEMTIRPVGSNEQIKINTRIIAATHMDLQHAVEEGRFRKDLYYRLHVLHLTVPRLSERESDVELLAHHFMRKFARENGSAVKGFSKESLSVINHYSWPGNVRELMNRIRRAMLLSGGPYVSPADLELERRSPRRWLVTLDEFRDTAEKEAVQASLRRTRHNVSRAARELGVSRVTLYRLMEKYGIS